MRSKYPKGHTTFQAAFGKTLGADVTGIMNATILGQDGYSTFVPIPVTSIPGLNQALGAYYWWYTLGYELHIDFDNPHMMHRINGHKIPLFFDPAHKAWYIVFCVGDKPVENFSNYISWYNENDLPKFKEYIQGLEDRRKFWCEQWSEAKLDGHDVDGFVAALTTHELEELERSIQPLLGAKGNVCPAFKKLTRAQLHALHGHISYLEGCVICEAIRTKHDSENF
eukprot:COSAG01_NODE_212_length_21797_cov_14.197806_11_plen_225_part_00